MSVKDRLKIFINNQKLTVSAFESSIIVSNGYVNSISKSLGVDKLELIIEKYPNLNITWLLSGKGEMLLDKPDKKAITHQLENCQLCAEKDRTITAMEVSGTYMKEKIEQLKDRIHDLETRLSQSA